MAKQQGRVLILLVVLLNASLTGIALAADAHWTYTGDTGPDHWAELSPDFALCASGLEQSPIDIAASSPANPAHLRFDYRPSRLTLVNNGHTIQANYDAGSAVEIDGQSYSLVQFHFHNPSEHTVDGAATPMELHLVHANHSGGLAVVGVFLIEGEANAALAPVFDHLPANEGEPVAVNGATIHAADMLPADPTYWRYDGSLTTPPCSESVKWHVMQNPVEISAAQLAAYTTLFHGNARPVQPLNARAWIVGPASPAPPPAALPATGAANDPRRIILVVASAVIALSGYSVYRRRSSVL